MAQLLDLLRVATPPPSAKTPAISLRDVLLLTALGYSLASAAAVEPFSIVDEQVFKVLHVLLFPSCCPFCCQHADHTFAQRPPVRPRCLSK